MERKIKIVYMGGGVDYTIAPLDELIKRKYEIACVYIKKPRPSGRGRKIKNSALLEYVIKKNLNYRTPENFKEEEQYLNQLKPDIFIVFSYGIILPKKILDIPKKGCINIHASLLPKWRGPSPVQYALINNEKKTGFCFMKMNQKVDAGELLYSKEIEITKLDNTESLLNRISIEASYNLAGIIEDYVNNQISLKPQNNSDATYSYKIKKNDTFLNFNESAKLISGKIRAFFPNPGARCIIKGELVKILEAEVEFEESSNKNTGITLDNKLLISCKRGNIRFTKIQRQGKKAMDVRTVLNGWNVEEGTKINV